MEGFECPFCHTSADAPVVLIPIPGTERDGIAQAKQVHKACLDLAMEMTRKEEGDGIQKR
jgi:hypothetical protein